MKTNLAKTNLTASQNIVSPLNSELYSRLCKDENGFKLLSEKLIELTGIHLALNNKNTTLMASRLIRIIEENDIKSYRDLYQRICKESYLQRVFIHSMTTNTTQFFRENAHFDFFRSYINEYLIEKSIKHDYEFRIWCSASSTGQEPYSILMTLLESIGNKRQFQIKFLATDIDEEVLTKASMGIYSALELKGVPEPYLFKYFNKISSNAEVRYQFKTEYRNLIRFAQLNLLDAFPFKHQFDIVFCRNVLIYFQQEVSKKVISKMIGKIKKNGLLFLGHSEAGLARFENIESVSAAVYKVK